MKINEVISLGIYDIISLNETKLDETIPFSFFSNPNYDILRRKRFWDDGGLLVLIKKKKQKFRRILKEFQLIFIWRKKCKYFIYIQATISKK